MFVRKPWTYRSDRQRSPTDRRVTVVGDRDGYESDVSQVWERKFALKCSRCCWAGCEHETTPHVFTPDELKDMNQLHMYFQNLDS